MPQALYPVLDNFKKQALLRVDDYKKMYQMSIDQPEDFWGEQAKKFLDWIEPWEKVLSGGFDLLDVKWFQGGKLNAAYNCLDRHLKYKSDKIAIYWEGDNPNHSQKLTYKELHERVGRFANVLKRFGIKRGDRVCIYLPMIPEAVIAMLACARIGAVHTIVFAGFSKEALRSRLLDAGCQLIITANEGTRGGKVIPLKNTVDAAIQGIDTIKAVIVVKLTENPVQINSEKDYWYHNLISSAQVSCPVEIMDSLDPLFILYTSGSTGKPKGILHGTGGYLLYAAITFKYVFDYHGDEIHWCTADIGWITGHTYVVYGPLLNGATIVLHEGTPTYPTPARCWEIVDKYNVNIFYTAPTAIRALRREGNHWLKTTTRKSLRILGTVGEPINPSAWEWFYRYVGNNQCSIVDTWWQTETGGIMITPIPGLTPLKPGSACWPFFGVAPKIVDDNNQSMQHDQMGRLVIQKPWPGMMQSVYGDEARFESTYFKEVPGYYLSGDLARCDVDGYYWIAGRSDDIIKVSGHRIGTGEVESALTANPAVAEAAVVPVDDEIKGQSIYAFVVLKPGLTAGTALEQQLMTTVREQIGAIAIPKTIQWAKALPKTRSGKIMRRVLRKIANHTTEDLGDLSTLANPETIADLEKNLKTS